jgi:hypothetical protein
MQKKIIWLTFFVSAYIPLNTNAEKVFKDNPYTMFSAKENHMTNTNVEWRSVKDIQKECEKESKKRGLGGFGYAVTACSFWNTDVFGSRCLIITSFNVNMHTLGHEVRHCFQGNYHP